MNKKLTQVSTCLFPCCPNIQDIYCILHTDNVLISSVLLVPVQCGPSWSQCTPQHRGPWREGSQGDYCRRSPWLRNRACTSSGLFNTRTLTGWSTQVSINRKQWRVTNVVDSHDTDNMTRHKKIDTQTLCAQLNVTKLWIQTWKVLLSSIKKSQMHCFPLQYEYSTY